MIEVLIQKEGKENIYCISTEKRNENIVI